MRFSRRKRASDGGEDQDRDQDGGDGGQAQRRVYRRRIRIVINRLRFGIKERLSDRIAYCL